MRARGWGPFVVLAVLGFGGAAAALDAALLRVAPRAAVHTPAATSAMLLGAAWAGARAVAVGEHGVVLLADDEGRAPPRQAQVPLDATLTAVHFADERHGWAVGHWGAIVASDDGGATWRRQRIDLDEDRPLFAVHFFDARHGVAVGLWSLVLTTDDGGRSWRQRELAPPPGAAKADLNLWSLFADREGRVYATGERGFVLRSDDRGATWRYLATGYNGSLWSGIALGGGALVVGGQRGSLWRSDDDGASWRAVDLGARQSVTAFAARGDTVVAVGLDGLVATSADGGRSFVLQPREDRLSLTAVLAAGDGRFPMWSRAGAVPP